ncbi:hypothetical protein [Methylobacterium nonmethylotrophicum]|uniref:Uncharacterized protein n=1 Tax=Methylobacterium nonmethylotrophicum TaxID=1141884 RepID=A0A4Z0NCG9_9HYPH|nr:hypothetical protein [Methylobacterium nonmethylotrophicum]TGD91908.1 hypothetical protein EU555_35370 [Methylobacterium nonmethylotrophicum]
MASRQDMLKSRLQAMTDEAERVRDRKVEKPYEPESSKPDEAKASHVESLIASKPQKAESSKPDKATALEPLKADVEPPRRARPLTTKRGAKAKPKAKPPASGVEKKSSSIYLTDAARRALNTLAAQQGVRPHRVIDDALRIYFARHKLDFDALNGGAEE